MTRQPKKPKLESSRAARSDYLKYAQRVIGDSTIDYPTLYARFVENDWAADKLDEAVALEALRAGETPRWVISRLRQSPYMQYQLHENNVPLVLMARYARSIVISGMSQAKMLWLTPPRQQG